VSVRGWFFGFDWSRSGGYGGALEDVSGYVSDDDLTITVGRDTSQAASDIPAGTLDFTLAEKDGPGGYDFAPESTTSAIAGMVEPGVPATFNVTVASATTTLFTGTLDKFTYTPEPPATLAGTVMDAWGKPGAERLSTTVYTGMRTGDLIGVVLDAIGWTGGRDIDPGATLVPFWWEEGTDAATAVQKLIDSEGPPAIGYVYAGTFVFRDRHHRILDAPSVTSQATFTHRFPEGTGAAGDFKIARGSFSYDHGLSSIVNTASFTVDVRTIDDPIAVWQTDSPISVAAGATITYTVNASDPFVNAQVPIPVSGFDDAGNPISGDYILAYGAIGSISISRTSGQSLTLTIVGGGSDALFTRMQVQANPVTVGNSQTVSVVDAGSVASKGTLTWPGALPWAGVYDAYAIAQRIVSVYATARPVMTFEIDGLLTNAAGVSYMAQFTARQVSDRITVRHDLIGFNGDCHIEKVERVVRSLGKNSSLLRLTVEPVSTTGAVNPFTFNVAGKGFNDGQFDADGIDNPSSVFQFDVAGHGFDQGRFAS
jgi:hypothetical protein